jgi:hypothetical protein
MRVRCACVVREKSIHFNVVGGGGINTARAFSARNLKNVFRVKAAGFYTSLLSFPAVAAIVLAAASLLDLATRMCMQPSSLACRVAAAAAAAAAKNWQILWF